MILNILRLADRLDKALEQTFGRPYRVVLSVGLVISIVHQAEELMKAPQLKSGVVGKAIEIMFGLCLLTNQMGELSRRFDRQRARRRQPPPDLPA